MKLSNELNDALNQQVLHEYHNMLIYKQIQSFFEDMQLKKIAQFFGSQAQQEKDHGDKFIQYINDRTGGRVTLGEIDSPVLFEGIDTIAKVFVETEEGTTESIEALYGLALDEKSYIDLGFLQEMLVEQVEEEDMANEFATKLRTCKDLVLFDATLEVR